jgi:hypothetical protein
LENLKNGKLGDFLENQSFILRKFLSKECLFKTTSPALIIQLIKSQHNLSAKVKLSSNPKTFTIKNPSKDYRIKIKLKHLSTKMMVNFLGFPSRPRQTFLHEIFNE